LFDVRSFAVYTKSVLTNFSQVFDNKLQLDMAINACGLQGTHNIKTQSFGVKKERKRRVEELERKNSIVPIPRREGMIVVTVPTGDDDDKTSGEISPLTTATDASTTILSRKKKKSRGSPQQAGKEKINAKLEHEELSHLYKAAFKQGTAPMADLFHDETVYLIFERLNVKHCLIGKSCVGVLFTELYPREVMARRVQPAKKGPPPKIPDALLESMFKSVNVVTEK
jgi:hypothetical protein